MYQDKELAVPALPEPAIKEFFQNLLAKRVEAVKAFIEQMPSVEAKQALVNTYLTKACETEKAWSFPLYIVAKRNSIELVALLIAAGANVNQAGYDGATPLLVAVKEGHLAIVECLLSAHADVNQARYDGATPLFVAAYKGYQAVVERLLMAQADVNLACDNDATPLYNGATPLYIAAWRGHLGVVECLLLAHADVNHATRSGATPLFTAAYNGHLAMVEYLLSAHATVNRATSDGSTPLYVAAQNGHQAVVECLLSAQANVHRQKWSDGMTPLCVAAQNGHQAVVKCLLSAQADVNEGRGLDGKAPLYVAAEKGHLDVVKCLLAAGAGLFGEMPALSFPSGLAGQVVIGLEVNNERVNRKTPGFEQAITNLEELNQALLEKPLANSKALMKACDCLLQREHPEQQTLLSIKARLYNLNSLLSRCLYELHAKPTYQVLRRQIYDRQISLPGELVSQLAELEDTPPKLTL